jgi:PD-(D/E)XK nuclease superfamily
MLTKPDSPVQALLDDISLALGSLREGKKKFAAQLAPDFRIFDYLRDDEMGLSKCFADLLNPEGKHGQGRLFLDGFLTLIDWHKPPMNCKVQLEKQTFNQRRIDIYLEFDDGNGLIGIENKPWAGDQPNQLIAYATYLRAAAQLMPWKLIYFCNQEPSTESFSMKDRDEFEKSGNYLQLTYTEIATWLEHTAAQTKALVVRVYVEELVKFIRKHINREADMSESNEAMTRILSKDHFLPAAFDVSNALPALKNQLILKLKTQLLSAAQGAEGVFIDNNLHWNLEKTDWWNVSSTKKYTGFTFWLTTVRFERVALRFAFGREDYDDFYWGITSFAPKRPNNDAEKSETIFKLFEQQLELKKSNKTDHWAFWSGPNTNFTPDWKKNWGGQVIPWQAIHNNTLANELLLFAVKVRQVLDQGDYEH